MEDDKSGFCCAYCAEYDALYKTILCQGMRWLTISPPISDIDPDKYLDAWIDDLENMRKVAKNMILVVEFANLRMHFHAVYSVKDKKKEYIILNGYRKGNQVRVYNGEPTGGRHYLFKDVDVAKEIIDKDPIMTMATFDAIVEKRKEQIRLERLKAKEMKLTEFTKDIPKWMLSNDDDSMSSY